MTTSILKLNDVFNSIREDLMDSASHGRLHGIVINSAHQQNNLRKAFESVGLAFTSTENVQIQNAVPGFVTMVDEGLSKALCHAMRGRDCDVARMTLNSDAHSVQDVIKAKYVAGGLNYGSRR